MEKSVKLYIDFKTTKKDTMGAAGMNSLLLLLMPLQLLQSLAMAICLLCSQTTMHSSTFNSEFLQSHRTFSYIHSDQHFSFPKHHSVWVETLIITLFGLLDFFMLLESFQKQGRPRIILERTFIRMPTMPTFQMPASWSITFCQLTYVLQHAYESWNNFLEAVEEPWFVRLKDQKNNVWIRSQTWGTSTTDGRAPHPSSPSQAGETKVTAPPWLPTKEHCSTEMNSATPWTAPLHCHITLPTY